MVAAAWVIYLALASPLRPAAPNPRTGVTAPREPESFRFREDVDPRTAAEMNAAVPESAEPLVSARPFAVNSEGIAASTRLSALDCMTAAVYYEAASESPVGQRAVAQVILNRMRHPAYPSSVCGVVFQGSQRRTGCQFTFTCDGSLARRPSQAGWARARGVAAAALAGYVEPSVGLATHYHTQWVVPYWSANLTKLRTVGAHIFYRWSGGAGTQSAFTNRYANSELIPVSAATFLSGFLLSGAPLEPGAAPAATDLGGFPAAPQLAVPASGLLPRGGELSTEPASAVAARGGNLERSDYRLKSDADEHRMIEDRGYALR